MENTFNYNSLGTFKLKALIRQHFIHRVSLMIKSMDIYATQEEIQILITDFISNSEIEALCSDKFYIKNVADTISSTILAFVGKEIIVSATFLI